jgi:uncharacterized protein YjlB
MAGKNPHARSSGIARGDARVQFGGAKGRVLHVKAGDVIVLRRSRPTHRKAKPPRTDRSMARTVR